MFNCRASVMHHRCLRFAASAAVLFWVYMGAALGEDVKPPADDGLLAHWRFDEKEGAVAKDALQKHNGTVVNPQWGEGIFGGALVLNGKDTFVNIDNSKDMDVGASDFTLALWVKPTGDKGFHMLSKDRHSVMAGMLIFELMRERTLAFSFIDTNGEDGPRRYISNKPVPLNEWSHVAVTRAGKDFNFYINGVKAGSVNTRTVVDHKNDLNWRIGNRFGPGKGDAPDPGAFGPGLVDDVRIYNRALTEKDFARIMLPVALGENLPDLVLEGKKIELKLLKDAVKGTFQIEAGPKGASVNEAGILTWTPATGDVGVAKFLIKALVDGNHFSIPFQTKVVSKAMADKVGGDLAKASTVGRLTIGAPSNIEYAADQHALVVVSGREVYILDEDGLVVREKLTLEQDYAKVFLRKDYFVALAKGSLDLLDRKTGKVKKSIDLKCSGTNDLVIDPTRPVSWVALIDPNEPVKDGITILAEKVVKVDETSGEVSKFKELRGAWLGIHPSGKVLYTSLKHLDEFEAFDILLSYDVSGNAVKELHTNKAPGINGQHLRVSPDGKWVSYPAGGGYRSGAANMNGYTVPAFRSEDIRLANVAFDVGPFPGDISYHPSLPWVACSVDGGLYELASGKKVGGKVDFEGEKFGEVTRFLFSPSGKYMVIAYKNPQGQFTVRAFGMILTDAEKELAAKGVKPAENIKLEADPAARTVDQNVDLKPAAALSAETLEALTAQPGAQVIPTKQVAKEFQDAVVVIQHDSGSGTGFFVGSSGCILTCAHVLPKDGAPKVFFKQDQGAGAPVLIRSRKVSVLRVDKDLDLALIQIDASATGTGRVAAVRFEGPKIALETGDDISVIGNPGVGDKIFENTLTTGVISQVKREIDGKTYYQINAAVNPGSSGAPVFDNKGNVIGVVALKAKLEGVGLAVPIDQVRTFLAEALKSAK